MGAYEIPIGIITPWREGKNRKNPTNSYVPRQLTTSQPSILAIQVWHIPHIISHVLQMTRRAVRLVKPHLGFCTSWGQKQ